MKKKINLVFAVLLIVAFSTLTCVITTILVVKSLTGDLNAKYTNLHSLDEYVRQNFYGEIDEKSLSDGILKGYVEGLGDKYSRYLPADDYEKEKNDNAGKMTGIGVTVSEDENGAVKIVEVMPDSPASDAGIMADDVIIKINDMDTAEMGFEESLKSISEADEIRLTVQRGNIEKNYTLARRNIELQTVSGELLENRIGYIKISGFKENTTKQFLETFDKITAMGAEGIIFDLRDNGGGLLESLEKCLDPLLPEGTIATAEYNNEKSEKIVVSDSEECNLPMIVLVNGNTASAGELFSASLRDFGKAELVGTQTYGKGVMQTTAELSDGGAVILTIAEYKTSVSECYDKIGLTPDYVVEDEDGQLDKAVEVISKKIN
ncbi:MAG: PDZ domain-containing protein [Ruminococcus sp.]|nr:PDZ domain-containing protein [Ruminococcus sp.]